MCFNTSQIQLFSEITLTKESIDKINDVPLKSTYLNQIPAKTPSICAQVALKETVPQMQGYFKGVILESLQ